MSKRRKQTIAQEAETSALLYDWKGTIIFTPSGDCPFKLKNTNPATIRQWANSVIRLGHQKEIHYSPAALRYFIRTMTNPEFTDQYDEICEVINKMVPPDDPDMPDLVAQGEDHDNEFETLDQENVLDDDDLELADDDSSLELGQQFSDDTEDYNYFDDQDDFRTIQRDNYHSHHGRRQSTSHFVPNRQTTTPTYYGREKGNSLRVGKPTNVPTENEKEKDIELSFSNDDYSKPKPKNEFHTSYQGY